METKEVGKLKHIEVVALLPSPWNRSADGNGEMKELVESIRAHGILQPLIVRAQETGWEIVAGHRRWKAAVKAGLKEVPCIVAQLSDQDAKVAQITENLMRKDLTPIEEAQAFKALQEGNAHTPQTVADIVGKNVKYVHRSLELLKLPKAAIQALEKGILSAAHGHQLARVGPKQIDMAVKFATTKDWHNEMPSVEALKHFIAQKVGKSLVGAPFPTDCGYAGQIACTKCPYNSGNQDVLFEGASDGHCTNTACFTKKMTQVFAGLQAEGEKKYPGLKFLGAAREGYGDQHVIKGHIVVDPTPKIKEQLAKSPEKFGFGILKPGAYGSTKKPRVVLAVSDAKVSGASRNREQGGYQEPSPEERAKQEFAREFFDREQAIEVWGNVSFGLDVIKALILGKCSDAWQIERATPWLNAAGFDLKKPIKDQVRAMAEGPATLLCWLLLVRQDDSCMKVVLNANEIDFKKKMKVWQALGTKEWEDTKEARIAAWKKEHNIKNGGAA